MKSMSMLSAEDKDSYLSECEPGESVMITGTLGEPDASGNYPVTVSAAEPAQAETSEEEDTEEMPMKKGMMKKKPAVAAVLNAEEE